MIIGENVKFNIHVDTNKITLYFDKKCDHAIVPWQDAFNLAEVMGQVVTDVKKDFNRTLSRDVVIREQAQIKLAHDKGLVLLKVDWTDRIEFTSIEAFDLVARALKHCAQDCHLSERGIRFKYKKGFISKIINTRNGVTQHVR